MSDLERLIEAAQAAPDADVRDAANLIVTRHIEREREAERQVKHAAAQEACSECASRIERLQLEFASANAAYLELDRTRQDADERLSAYLARKPSGYASKLAIETFEGHVSELEAAVAVARVEVIAADQKRSEISVALVAAIDELEARPAGLAFKEEQLRPRQKTEPHFAGGQLLGVR